MIVDNRLDFITSFEDGAIELMTEIRRKFIELDNELRKIMDVPCQPSGQRSFSNARTRLEESLQHSIKGICLKYEKKENK